MNFLKQHTLVVIGIVVVLAGVGWYEFTSNSAPAPVLTATGIGTSTSSDDAQLVSTLLQLQAVTLNGTILSDPGFLSLQDFTTQIVTEPIGRTNPFAPLSPGTAVVSTSTQTLTPNLFAPKASDQ